MDPRFLCSILHFVTWKSVHSFCWGKLRINSTLCFFYDDIYFHFSLTVIFYLFLPFWLNLFLKLTYMMAISVVMSLIPSMLSFIKQPIYNWAALTCFRILSRSFSGVVTFHNKQHRPKSDGICVANHTTPIDVVVLSCDRSYALVTCTLKFIYSEKATKFWEISTLLLTGTI